MDHYSPGEQIDLTSQPPSSADSAASGARRFIGVHFTCCDVYNRVYINRQHTAYEGHCPRCARAMRVLIGPGGSNSRFFSAG